MPPQYKCRYCLSKIIVDPKENKTLFYVKDKKGNYGNEWECKKCYTGRVCGPMTNRDSYRVPKPEVSGDPAIVNFGGYNPSVEE